jgi:hypothetical protein
VFGQINPDSGCGGTHEEGSARSEGGRCYAHSSDILRVHTICYGIGFSLAAQLLRRPVIPVSGSRLPFLRVAAYSAVGAAEVRGERGGGPLPNCHRAPVCDRTKGGTGHCSVEKNGLRSEAAALERPCGAIGQS